ncbi:MLO-like protein 11 [Linum perenne]
MVDYGEMALALTPTWAVGTVVTVMIAFGFFFQWLLKYFGKFLHRTKRKALLSALYKIKDELTLFGLISLLMGHWLAWVAKICVKTTYLNSRFYFCDLEKASKLNRMVVASVSHQVNNTVVRDEVDFDSIRGHCPPVCMRLFCSYYEWCYLALIKFRSVFNFVYKGHESFASHDSLEQLHRLMFVLAVTHVSYSFAAIALAMIKIYSWRSWENQAKQLALQNFEGKGIHSPVFSWSC